MDEHLVFRLAAPLASWGDIAVGEMRPSANRPTRSCLVGLIAACRGIRRENESELRSLDGLRLAYRLDEPGLPLHDYHTIQVPRNERDVRFRTRRDEIGWTGRDSLETILSSRVYRSEIRAQVVVNRLASAVGKCPALTEIAESMDQPVFSPYLGRRSCPLALPFLACVVSAPDFVMASRMALQNCVDESSIDGGRSSRDFSLGTRWFWEDGCHSPVSPQSSHHRYDRSTSQRNRLFAERIEHEALIPWSV
jgi:CRISPR system Cascade subunit CasD